MSPSRCRLAWAVGAVLALVSSAHSAIDRPNILWITAEDMSPNLGCYGDALARTPHLDALAREAVRYTRAFATAPVCAPARACLITGVYATSLGNPHLRCTIHIPASFRAYSAILREAGYFCANNVKTDYNLANEREFIQDAWDVCSPQAHWRLRRPGQPFFSIFNLMETHQSRSSVWSWDEFEKLAAARLPAADRADSAKVPLPPYYPDTPLARRALARYYDCVQIMDREVGRILAELAADGLAEETIVFFYSDHGMGMPRGKRLLHDSGLHVPLLVRFPKKYQHLAPVRPGETTDQLVSFVDFPPTLLSLAGLPVPAHMQGVAFLGRAAGPARSHVYGARDRVDEVYETARSVRDGRWLYLRNYSPHLSWAQPEGYSDQSDFRRHLLELAATGGLNEAQMTFAGPSKPLEELYDTESDPHQVRNLAGRSEHTARLAQMRRLVRDWIVSTRDTGFIPEQQLVERRGVDLPWAFAQDRARYPLERILAAADLVGRPGMVGKQTELLGDEDSAVRYWAAVGLRAAGAQARPARAALRQALSDRSLSVRVEAAGTLLASEAASDPEALAVLTEVLHGEALHAGLHAARTLQLLGEKARPALPSIQARLASLKGLPDADKALQIGFALNAAVAALDRR